MDSFSGVRITPLIEYLVLLLNALTVLVAVLLTAKGIYYAINRKIVRSHLANFWIAGLTSLLVLIILLVVSGTVVLHPVTIGLCLAIYVPSLLLLEIADMVIFWKWKWRIVPVLLVAAFAFYFYPRQILSSKQTANNMISTTYCQCAGIKDSYGIFCFGLLHTCNTTEQSANILWSE